MGFLNKLAIAGVIVVILSSVVGFWGFWKFITYKLTSSVNLAPDTDIRKAWEKAPIAIDFKVYIFNITNPWEVHNGSKPVLQEIGPFAFFEWKEKVNVVDHNGNDTVSFNMKNTWIFNPEGSGGLTMDEIVVVPHMAMLGLVYIVEKRKPGSLRVVNNALPALYNSPETVFLTTSVRDLLFDGNVINCTSTEFAPSALCSAIRAQSASLHKVSDDIFKFSLFGVKNGTPEAGTFNVKRGTENYKDVGRVLLYNHEPQLYVWDGSQCNKLEGTDSTVFPALLSPQDDIDDIVSFSPDLCRSLGAKYQYSTEYQGFSAYSYTASLGDMANNPAEHCFCPTADTCLKKGALDLTECLESPIIVTLPHFYDTDPSYLETVEGLHPRGELHQIFLIFEPITGTPLSARKRLQFNIHLHAVKKVKIMINLPDALLPIFWVEEGVDLDQKFLDILDKSLFRPLRWVFGGRWVFLTLGLLMIATSFVIRYAMRNNLMPTYFDHEPAPTRRKTPSPAQVMDLSPSSTKY
ncbi:sensory neuron membrane protein 1-like [Homalodisca vitripennis]|uniref:sensory neuron membrane protein 1-like n=1 Tax=Homalodisca vitripennis TaxID=197043 RepID=UPI001EEAAEE9|nr:sensory neuron membrane protein 1-like [Homalodisca vitripennis]